MIDRSDKLPVVRQCELLNLSRSSVYSVPQPASEGDLALMRRIDELHLNHPFAGARMLRDFLGLAGVPVGRRHVSTLMRKMGIELAFKRLKSLLQLGHLKKIDQDGAKAWLQGKLLVACLIETLILTAERFSPWGYPCDGRGISPSAVALA